MWPADVRERVGEGVRGWGRRGQGGGVTRTWRRIPAPGGGGGGGGVERGGGGLFSCIHSPDRDNRTLTHDTAWRALYSELDILHTHISPILDWYENSLQGKPKEPRVGV